jgi:succinoglycan biosynthesis protein ExoA
MHFSAKNMLETDAFLFSRIVVAVPTLNEEQHIGHILDGLVGERRYLPNLEIVVADGGSIDSTRSIVERYADRHAFVHFINNPRQIQSAAVNLVANMWVERADILVRCDAHSGYPDDFLLRLVATLDQTSADSVVVPMDTVGRSCVGRAVAWISDSRIGSGGSAHRGGRRSGYVDHGHHAAFRLQSFLQAGGYDETFTHNEDAELDCRLGKAGGRIFLDADIRVKYAPRERLSALARQYFNYGKGRARTMSRHPDSARLRQYAVPIHLLLLAATLIGGALAPVLLLWPAFYVSLTLATAVKLAVKHRSLCGLMASPAVIIMHNAWAIGFFVGILFQREKKWQPRLGDAQSLCS